MYDEWYQDEEQESLPGTDWEWRPTSTGGWITFEADGGNVVLFKKSDGWGVAHNGYFSKGSYESAEDAANAFEGKNVQWVWPYAWKTSKKGGRYRRDPHRGVLSVKQAKSGSWYWTSTNDRGPHGWFATAEEAMEAADCFQLGQESQTRIPPRESLEEPGPNRVPSDHGRDQTLDALLAELST